MGLSILKTVLSVLEEPLETQLKVDATEATEVSVDIAGLGARSLAFITDWHLRFTLALTWFLGSLYFFKELDVVDFSSGDFDFAGMPFLVTVGGASAIYLLYHPVLEIITRGRTPGKRFAGIRVAMNDGRAPTTGATVVRNLFRVVDSAPGLYVVGFMCGLCTARSVRLGDLAAGTVLVYDERVAKKAFDDLEEKATFSGLDPSDQSVLMDLLDRWHRLAPARRATFAREILQRANVGFADIDAQKPKSQGPLLRQRLLKLANTKRQSTVVDKQESVRAAA